METLLYYAIPLITGIICWILGFLIGKSNAPLGDGTNYASLKADLSACRANSKNLSDKVAELEHQIYEYEHAQTSDAPVMNAPNPTVVSSAKAPVMAFDADKAKAAFGKKVKQDDLKLVEGIGPKIAEHFIAGGIKTWQELANASVEDCQKILTAAGDRYTMHNPGTWPRQAKLMVDGKWDELKAWTDTLDGGKE